MKLTLLAFAVCVSLVGQFVAGNDFAKVGNVANEIPYVQIPLSYFLKYGTGGLPFVGGAANGIPNVGKVAGGLPVAGDVVKNIPFGVVGQVPFFGKTFKKVAPGKICNA